jgi:hypothetical protein
VTPLYEPRNGANKPISVELYDIVLRDAERITNEVERAIARLLNDIERSEE